MPYNIPDIPDYLSEVQPAEHAFLLLKSRRKRATRPKIQRRRPQLDDLEDIDFEYFESAGQRVQRRRNL